MARRYNVQGTNNYLIAAVVMLLIGAWHMWDGWFPRPAVLDVHPKTITVKASVDAEVREIPVKIGEQVSETMPVIKLMASEAPYDDITLSLKEFLNDKSKVHVGEVTGIKVALRDKVKAGEPLVDFDAVRDSFYLYNKTTTILMFLGAAVCAAIHLAVR